MNHNAKDFKNQPMTRIIIKEILKSTIDMNYNVGNIKNQPIK